MNDASITYFPVGNGDTILIRLSDKTDMIIDCNITKESRDSVDEIQYDVHDHLLKVLKKDQTNIPHVDVFILTHPDEDHCRGFNETFYTGDPARFSDSHRREGLILIGELWFTPRIFSPHEDELCEYAKVFRKEANRRMELYKNKKEGRNNPGNRLRIIGYTDNEEFEGLENIITIPGNSINLINGSSKDDFSFFVHAPFRKDIDSEWSERNDTSVILQARFDVDGEQRAGLAFLGGDPGCAIWEDILERSKDEDLQWDLFLAPHHCSWTFFSEKPYKDNKIPSEKSLELLGKKREGAIVIASCKPIKRDDDNPPHYAAAQQYKKVVGEKKFYATMEYPDARRPLPLKFEISRNGPVKVDSSKSSAIASSAAIQSTIGNPQTYGK